MAYVAEGGSAGARDDYDRTLQRTEVVSSAGNDMFLRYSGRGNWDQQAVGNRVPQSAEGVTEPNIEDLVSAVEIDVNGSCINMPLLRSQELKIIGRCVTFLGDTIVEGQRVQLHYEGVVGMVTKDTVMLLHVRRFTPEDFLKYQEALRAEQEKEEREKELNGGKKVTVRGHKSENILDSTRSSEEQSNEHCEVEGNRCTCSLLELNDVAGNGDFSTEVPFSREGRGMGAGSLGPVPFMTISRRRISNVVFGRDSLTSSYSIFRCPLRRLFDMQYLRMFVRRYLVHTSQGNNPRDISFRSFIQWRCNCNNIDDELLVSVAKEELAFLLKNERDMTKASKRFANGTRNIFRSYRPSDGIFRETGVLFLTHIPVQTFCLAILELLLTVLMLCFSAYSFATAEVLVIYGYVKDYATPVTAAVIISLLGSGATALHSLRMRLPLNINVYGVVRLVFVTAAIGLNTMVLVMVGEALSFLHIRNYLLHLSQISLELCGYYTIHNCRGFGEDCTSKNVSPICMLSSCSLNQTRSCTQEISASFIRLFIPIVVFSMVLIALFIIDHFLHYRLVQVSRMLLPQF